MIKQELLKRDSSSTFWKKAKVEAADMPKGIKKYGILVIVTVLMLAASAAWAADGVMIETVMYRKAIITLIVLALAAVLFLTELIPLAVTAMSIPVVLVLTGVLSEKEAFNGLANSTVVLFAGMFVVGAALFETGVAQWIGDKVVSWAHGSEILMTFGVMALTAILSSVLSNTGTVAVLLPVCIGIADVAGFNRGKLLMPLAMMASLGGMISLVGTPPNGTVNTVLETYGEETFGFFEFAWVGLPLTIVGMVYLLTIGRILLPADKRLVDDSTVHREGHRVHKRSKQIIATAILLLTVIVMATEIIPLHVAAVAGAMLCVITGTITEKQAYHSIDWATIFLFAGTLSLATALEKTGAGSMIADAVIGIVGESSSPYVLVTVLFFLSSVLTQFMSNTASCALLAPIGLQIAYGLGANPHAILMTIGIAASSAFATPIATPPNTLVLGPGGLKFMDYVKIGLPLLVIAYVVCIVIIPWRWPFYPM